MVPDAKVIKDSIGPYGQRLTTMEVTFHRFVLAEFNTHRVFSRNSASSRAIPVERQLERVLQDPAWPLAWPREQRGMQGGGGLEGDDLLDAKDLFYDVWDETTKLVQQYIADHPDKSSRLHKSLINRLLEPFMWHTVIVSATEWQGFWDQRVSPLAQPEIHAPAELMLAAYESSVPDELGFDDWHLPYIEQQDYQAAVDLIDHVPYSWERQEHDDQVIDIVKRVSVARSARVSFLNHDGTRDLIKDIELFDKLVSAKPLHASPLEHVARPTSFCSTPGNFEGWLQWRHEIERLQS